jgi:ketosteroid isomerase-like protein
VTDAVDIVLQAFRAVERRDLQALEALYHPEIEFHWPPSLPYGGSARAREVFQPKRPTWGETWNPLQPTERERQLDPRVVAASEGEVVVLWRQKGVDRAGERFDGPALGLYRVRDGKFARAQMFYFDTVAVVNFLAQAQQRLRARPANSRYLRRVGKRLRA